MRQMEEGDARGEEVVAAKIRSDPVHSIWRYVRRSIHIRGAPVKFEVANHVADHAEILIRALVLWPQVKREPTLLAPRLIIS